MNKSELIAAMAQKSELRKVDVEKALNAFQAVVTEELSNGGKVQLVGFATFEVAERAAREGTNPQSRAKMVISAKKAVRFRAGSTLKDKVNQ